MSSPSDRFSLLSACLLIMAGVLFYLAYLVFLPLQDHFHNTLVPDIGLMLYSLATAGAGFVAWSWMLFSVSNNREQQAQQFKQRIMQASSIGFFMLGLMRLGTALFPHAPFQSMAAVPIAECVIFSLAGCVFLRKAAAATHLGLQPAQ